MAPPMAFNAQKRLRRENEFRQWARPALTLTPEAELSLMQVDIDYYTDLPHPKLTPVPAGVSASDKVPILRIYGLTEAGHSVMARVHGFAPYFYVQCPPGFQDTETLKKSLEAQLASSGARDKLSRYVASVEIVMKSSLMHFQGADHSPFFKVTVALPSLVATSRSIIERGFELVGGGRFPGGTSYETNIAFALRFMVDRGIVGGGWVKFVPGQIGGVEMRCGEECSASTCQMELDVHYEQVVSVDAIKIAPLRIFSFDIECVNPAGKGFPKAQTCPVIQIAVYLKVHGEEKELVHAVWTLNSCADIAGKYVFSFEKEAEMLMSFRDFLEQTDPDIITGYNIVNFDWPYLIERAEVLGLRDFARLGRVADSRTRVRVDMINGREMTEVNIDGRVQFDMLVVMQREQKLRSYSLNAVSAEFLGEQKEDVHYSMIGDLFAKNAETRRRLAIYCLKDAYLPVALIDKLLCMYNYVEMARVTGTPLNFLLNRGQMIKVTSQLLRKARETGFVMPTTRPQPSDDKFEGATVLEPSTGYYEKPIATLDFASLYPSIMMAHNICYTTMIRPETRSQFAPDALTASPVGVHFVKSTARRGLLPQILEELLAARKRAKKEMAEATDKLTQAVLNGRQLALKVSANSVYGYTGATNGQMPCLEISASVTAFGRTMIDETKRQVEAHYTIQNGYAHDAQVVYGDTDSVMVKFGVDTVAEAMKFGEEAADMVSKTFLRPIKLEFEKVYCPYLLMAKKRYAGLYWTNSEKYDKLDTKGIETVRRDNCALVRQVVDNVLNTILIDKSIPRAAEYVQGVIGDLLQNKVDLSLLVISKSLGKGANAEDYQAKQAHVELAERMRKRDPSTAPGSGDRVPYVITAAAKGVRAYARSEDPLYVLENNLCIDAQHYIDHQLHQPLMRIFGPIVKNAESMLFKGEHTRKVTASSNAKGALSKFATKSLRCMGCKSVIKEGSLCSHCLEDKGAMVVLEKVKSMREKEAEFDRLWTQCQRCQGSLLQTVICSNRDCEIFYRRAKAKMDVEAIAESMKRLELDVAW